MKNFIRALFFFLVISLAKAQEPASNSPERVLHDFYQWYVQALLQNREPLGKERAQLRRYASERLIGEIDRARKGPDGLDGDPFVDAQDFDRDWAKNIGISNLVISGKHATAKVNLKGKELGTHTLFVTLVRERAGWKLDKVEGER